MRTVQRVVAAIICMIISVLLLSINNTLPLAAQSDLCRRHTEGDQQLACRLREMIKTRPCSRHLLSDGEAEDNAGKTAEYVACLEHQDKARIALLDWMQKYGGESHNSDLGPQPESALRKQLLFAVILTKCQSSLGASRDFVKLHKCLTTQEKIEKQYMPDHANPAR